MDKVHFPKPVRTAMASQKPADKKVTSLVVQPAVPPAHTPPQVGRFKAVHEEGQRKVKVYQAIREMCTKHGFGIGAVVCRRYATLDPGLNPKNWGIITNLSRWHADEARYKPIEVEWMNRGKPMTTHHMNELLLIHGSVSDQEMRLCLQAQIDFDDEEPFGDC